MSRVVLLGLWLAWYMAGAAQTEYPTIVGTVFLDLDRDGQQNAGEPGVAGVVVSDQVTTTRTNDLGNFEISESRGFGVVSITLPDGYSAPSGFWRRSESGPLRFPLVEQPSPHAFSFVHASDTHVNRDSLPRLQSLRRMMEDLQPAFVLVTGDLVRDALRVQEAEAAGYYEMYTTEVKRFPVPVWSVPGNHENFGIERHRSLVSPEHPLYGKGMYRHYLGPNYYSFNYGGVHFVALDTVDIEDIHYYGHVDTTQLKWLEQDLAFLEPGTPVVTFNHIPLLSASLAVWGYNETPPAPVLVKVRGRTLFRHVVANHRDVLELLRPHNFTLALGGHVHARETLTYAMEDLRVRFHQAAAVVGPNRTPAGTMRSGITHYRVRDGVIDDGEFLEIGTLR